MNTTQLLRDFAARYPQAHVTRRRCLLTWTGENGWEESRDTGRMSITIELDGVRLTADVQLGQENVALAKLLEAAELVARTLPTKAEIEHLLTP